MTAARADLLDELLTLAVRLAREASRIHLEGLSQDHEARTVHTKSTPSDFVSDVDKRAEASIVAMLASARPTDGLLAEEGSSRAADSGVRWIIDPLDGTTNYLHRYPAFCASVAAEVDGEVAVGVVSESLTGAVFSAVRGAGAFSTVMPFGGSGTDPDRGVTETGEAVEAGEATRRDRRGAALQGERLRVAAQADLSRALVGTGFSFDAGQRSRQGAVIASLLGRVGDIRRSGAAALDLCRLAAGQLDAYFELDLSPWDWAAGRLIAEEAGARVAALPGAHGKGPAIVGAEPALFPGFLGLLAAAGAVTAPAAEVAAADASATDNAAPDGEAGS